MPRSDAKRLRFLAVEAMAAAAQMSDPNCRRIMINVAASYERLAQHAEASEADSPPPPDPKDN
jgi:hypothetical protein